MRFFSRKYIFSYLYKLLCKKQIAASYSLSWEQRKLGEVFNFHYGDGNNNPSNGGQYPVFGAGGIQGRYTKYNAENSIIIGHMGDAGCVSWGEGKHFVTYNGTITTPKDDVFTAKFGYYLLLNMNLRKYRGGSGLPFLTYDMLTEMETKCPNSKIETQEIADYFTQLDHLITLHQRKYDKLTNVKKSMLEKMFPKNGSNVPEIRFKGFTEAWEQRKFEEIAVRSSVICSDANLPRVEYEDIVSGAGRLNKDIYAKQSSKSGIAFHRGDVLYGKLRPYLQNWLLPTFDGLAVGDFWVLQPQNADSSFLYQLIQSRQFDEVANQSTGTKMPRADWKLVSKTVFSIPSNISEQAAIGTYFTALDNLITLHQRELEKLKNIKKSCLENMFV